MRDRWIGYAVCAGMCATLVTSILAVRDAITFNHEKKNAEARVSDYIEQHPSVKRHFSLLNSIVRGRETPEELTEFSALHESPEVQEVYRLRREIQSNSWRPNFPEYGLFALGGGALGAGVLRFIEYREKKK